MNWRQYDPATLEREVSPSSVLGGHYQPFLEAYRRQSDRAYQLLRCQRNIRFGAGPRAVLDFFPADQPEAPLLVFIHGGYWQELGKADSALLAPAWHEAGFAHAVIDYDLAPQASVSGIVAQCRQALTALRTQAGSLGFDPARIVLAGSSAGAHLVAMLCLADEAMDEDGPFLPPPIHAALLLSGVFALEPLVATSVNHALRLDAGQARALSPLSMFAAGEAFGQPLMPRLKRFPRTLLAWGDNETSWFKSQSADFALALHLRGVHAQSLEVAGCNHFDIVNAMGDPAQAFFRHCVQFASA